MTHVQWCCTRLCGACKRLDVQHQWIDSNRDHLATSIKDHIKAEEKLAASIQQLRNDVQVEIKSQMQSGKLSKTIVEGIATEVEKHTSSFMGLSSQRTQVDNHLLNHSQQLGSMQASQVKLESGVQNLYKMVGDFLAGRPGFDLLRGSPIIRAMFTPTRLKREDLPSGYDSARHGSGAPAQEPRGAHCDPWGRAAREA